MDPHVHFRTPGHSHKEDWVSGSKAAIHGGFTYVLDMPNTNPATTTVERIEQKNNIIKQDAKVHYGMYVGLTAGNVDKIEEIYQTSRKMGLPILGVKVYIGSSTGNLLVTRPEVIGKSLSTGIIHLFHCEDAETLENYNDLPMNSIADHEKKRPAIAASQGVTKIMGAIQKYCPDPAKAGTVYICHLSTEDEVHAIDELRKNGADIITEIAPHHLYLTLESIKDDYIYKVNPPIRSESHAKALRQAFNRDFFQVIGTDHAPHRLEEKRSSAPPSGMPGMETAFPALYSLYEKGEMDLNRIFKYMTSAYEIFNIENRGKLQPGNFADITIINRNTTVIKGDELYTKCDYSPFEGVTCQAGIDTVLVDGEILLQDGKITY